MSESLYTRISELRGELPDVPFADGVDFSALVAGDDNPVFLTLPLLEAGAVSRGGKQYGADAVQSVVEQINAKRPGGIKGHMSEAERATRFDLPSLMWVGATLKDGKAWGKAYIPRYAADVREYVVKSKARRATVATSIYGSAVMDGARVRGLDIETIDLADPARAGIKSAVAEPVITSEMFGDENMEGEMPDNNETLIAEMRGQRQVIQEQLDASRTRISELEARVAELTPHAQTVAGIREIIPQGDLVAGVREMHTAVAEMVRVQRATRISEAVTAALGDIAQNERGAALIREMVGEVATPEAATARVAELLQKDYVQGMLRALVVEMAGPGALVGGNTGGKTGTWKDSVIANAEKLAEQYGISTH